MIRQGQSRDSPAVYNLLDFLELVVRLLKYMSDTPFQTRIKSNLLHQLCCQREGKTFKELPGLC